MLDDAGRKKIRTPIVVNASASLLGTFSLDALQPTIQRLNRQAAAMNKLVESASVASALAQSAEASRRFAEIGKAMSLAIPKMPALFDSNIAQLFQAWEARLRPHNFTDLSEDEESALIGLSFTEVFGTYNAAPADVTRTLAGAAAHDVDTILADHATDIAVSCGEQLAEVSGDDGRATTERELATLGLRGVEAHLAHHVDAAQALLTVVLDSCLNARWGAKTHTAARKDVGPSVVDGTETVLGIYLKASHIPAIQAFEARSDGVRYSRHGTVHQASRKQYRLVNSMRAMTITTGVVAFPWD